MPRKLLPRRLLEEEEYELFRQQQVRRWNLRKATGFSGFRASPAVGVGVAESVSLSLLLSASEAVGVAETPSVGIVSGWLLVAGVASGNGVAEDAVVITSHTLVADEAAGVGVAEDIEVTVVHMGFGVWVWGLDGVLLWDEADA